MLVGRCGGETEEEEMKPRKRENGSAISSEEVNFLVFRYLQESGEEDYSTKCSHIQQSGAASRAAVLGGFYGTPTAHEPRAFHAVHIWDLCVTFFCPFYSLTTDDQPLKERDSDQTRKRDGCPYTKHRKMSDRNKTSSLEHFEPTHLACRGIPVRALFQHCNTGFAHSAFTFAYESQITKSSVAEAQVSDDVGEFTLPSRSLFPIL